MIVHRRGPRDYLAVPWRNGRGITVELAREDTGGDDASEGDAAGFLWRLSRADVPADGPFSRFAGVDRVLLLLDGAGMRLDFGPHGTATLDRRHAMARFSGDWETHCRLLDGPCRDLNVMVDRQRAAATVRVHAAGPATSTLADRTVLLPLSGDWQVGTAEGAFALDVDALLVVEAPGGGTFTATGRGALLEVAITLRTT